MTQDEIIEMAREAGGQVTTWVNHSTIQKTTTFTFESPLDYYVSGEHPEKYHIKFLEAFAHLVAAKEREACADLRNMLHGFDGKGRQEMVDAMNRGLDEYQALIKARGQA